jgi:hypothetical protein
MWNQAYNLRMSAQTWPHAQAAPEVDADQPRPCLCPACAGGGDVEFYMPPSSGVADNGKPIFTWDEAAAQITRSGNSWSSALGQAVTVTYGFRALAPTTMPSGTDGFSTFSEAQIIATEIALRLWADVANITFVRIGSGVTGTQAYTNSATMLFANYASGMEDASAFAYLPSPGATASGLLAGDVWVNISLANNQDLSAGSFGPHVLAHEIGHAIGLRHPSEYDGGSPTYAANASYWQDARMFTVMSYFGSSNVGGSLNAFAAGPQLHDIAAAQRLYGANMTTRTGDTVYGFNSNTGLAHFTIASATGSPVFSIWDAGGDDTLDLSGYTTPSEIDLRQEAFSGAGPGNSGVGVAVGNISIARGAIIENAIGGAGADTLIGNEAANRLTGNFGADTLIGGAGLDTAVFNATLSGALFARALSGAWRVDTGPDGTDSLDSIEFLQFADRRMALRPAEGSLDGNGTSDVLLQNTAGTVAVWSLTGQSVGAAAIIGAADVSYLPVGQGDFNGDGIFDVLFRQANGALLQWQLTQGGVRAVNAYAADAAWSISAIGDFDGDFKDDILWRSSSGVLAQWRMDGLAIAETAVFAVSDPVWTLAAAADFNGDGRDDLLWRNASGVLAQWTMNGLAVSAAGVFALSDNAWEIAGTGDFNGDLREDILWRSSSGVMALWLMDGTNVTNAGAFAVSDVAWSVSDIGDYNGDGRDDILWQGPDGTLAYWALNGFAVVATAVLGNPGAGWSDIA